MIVADSDALARLESPLNLMNRMKSAGTSRGQAMGLFGIGNRDKIQPSTITVPPPLPANPPEFINPFSKSDNALVPVKTAERPIAPTIPVQKEDNGPNLDNLLDNADSRIKLSLAHDSALGVMKDAIDQVKIKLHEIKADKLPSVVAAMSKVVNDIQRQRIDQNKGAKNQSVHFHYYTPTQKKSTDYEIIDVG